MNRIMKFSGIIMAVLAFAMSAVTSDAKGGKEAYKIYSSDGKEITYSKMLSSLMDADFVFLGETHNCPIAHWLEYEITKDIWQRDSVGLVIGAEMFETDNQLLVDEYVGGLISSDKFENEAKLWDNYYTDYYPLLSFAREAGLKFVATNVPRRYASFVKDNGLEALETLSDKAKDLIAPLPVEFEESEQSEAMFGFMKMIGGNSDGKKTYFSQAQALKDATMAWSISRNAQKRFIHYNGNFHSDFHEGIIPYLLKYVPSARVVTVCMVRQDEIGSLGEENEGRADFIVCVPTDMTMTY